MRKLGSNWLDPHIGKRTHSLAVNYAQENVCLERVLRIFEEFRAKSQCWYQDTRYQHCNWLVFLTTELLNSQYPALLSFNSLMNNCDFLHWSQSWKAWSTRNGYSWVLPSKSASGLERMEMLLQNPTLSFVTQHKGKATTLPCLQLQARPKFSPLNTK